LFQENKSAGMEAGSLADRNPIKELEFYKKFRKKIIIIVYIPESLT